MTLEIGWQDIALRLALTILGSALIGFNREEHRLAAGLRTTLLVGLAAAISMIQVNLLLNITGKAGNSFVVLDLMRLPLGILSGMGFIGAGAILRKDNKVLGVTTASTLWFVTVMGLCFGGGQIGLGLSALVLGFIVLTGLKYLEHHCKRDHRATLTLIGSEQTAGEDRLSQIAQVISQAGYKVAVSSVTLGEKNVLVELKYELRWYGHPAEKMPPSFLNQLSDGTKFTRVQWNVIV
ncbi:MAG: MgtC/SapB family protein [Verrucomicrobiia bacterium]